MTVCVSALADNGKAIVCIADKALSYGDYIQWDSSSSKMIQLEPSGSLVMFSGDERGTSRVIGALIGNQEDIGAGRSSTLSSCERLYKEALEEVIQILFLNRRLLTREQYVSAITATEINKYILGVAKEIDKFNLGCDLLVCGFDFLDEGKRWTPFLFDVSHPGIVVDMTHTGFHAIGSGSEKAISRMLWSEYKRFSPVSRVLYETIDAKFNAEMAIGVGYEWDAHIMLAGSMRSHEVPKEIKELLERAWSKYNSVVLPSNLDSQGLVF